MNAANYAACLSRLSQGDLVRAPVGMFVRVDDLAHPKSLDAHGPPLPYADPDGLAFTIPRLQVASQPVVGRVWYQPAIVVSPDCAIDKNPAQIIIAPIYPLALLPLNQQDGVRSGGLVNAVDLPADDLLQFADGSQSPFPHSYVELQRMVPVSPGLLTAQRMVAVSRNQLDRLQNAWMRFIALRELSTTGTLAATIGRRVERVRVAASSDRRHTVILTFEGGFEVVVFQEPRRKGPYTQSVRVRAGAFDPEALQSLVGTDLLIRFENDDPTDWPLQSNRQDLMKNEVLAAAQTTEVFVRCPDDTCVINLQNKRNRHTLRLQIVSPLPVSP